MSGSVVAGPTSAVPPASVGRAVSRLGGAFMISRYAKAAADEQGFEGVWTSYFAGRAGVLGEVPPDVVAAAVTFYPVDVVRVAWNAARAVHDVRESGRRYARACHEWGRVKLAGLEGVDRLAELALAVAREADVAGLPLFAAWRQQELPDDPEARASHALQLLREHRGGLHGAAVVTSPLTPLQAILAGPGGQANAAFFGWLPPFEDVSACTALREEVERTTEAAAARAYAVLDDAEQAELATLLEMAVEHVYPRATLGGR